MVIDAVMRVDWIYDERMIELGKRRGQADQDEPIFLSQSVASTVVEVSHHPYQRCGSNMPTACMVRRAWLIGGKRVKDNPRSIALHETIRGMNQSRMRIPMVTCSVLA